MKLVMDEKLKHRLIGVAVIISLGAIFAPAVMKKSSQRLEGNYSVNIKLPPKPIAPGVVMTDEKEVFQTIKVAKLEIPPVDKSKQLETIAKAETLRSDLTSLDTQSVVAQVQEELQSKPVQMALNEAASSTAKKIVKEAGPQIGKSTVVAIKQKPVSKIKSMKPVKVARKVNVTSTPQVKKSIYAVQLASFSQLTNAQTLVNRLRKQGYKANYSKATSRNGSVYKVYVGYSPRKFEVIKLKNQLASAMQLNGFVVNTGVS